jgi:high-affinity K+ transport system ATPase subunit B
MADDKYKILYEYQKAQFDDEKNRFSKIEDKATKFLTTLSFFIPLFIFFSTKIFEKIDSSNCFFYWIIVFIITLILFSASSAWWAILRSMRLIDSMRMPTQKIREELFNKNSLDTCYVELSELYSNMVDMYRRLNTDKTEFIKLAYNEILFTAGFFLLLVILTSVLWVI